MQWLYGLFIRPEIHAFIQNYIDDPHRWKVYSAIYRFINEKDSLFIEFHPHCSSVYQFVGRQIRDRDDLRFFEKRLLCLAFKRQLAIITKPIPTKAPHLEEFI